MYLFFLPSRKTIKSFTEDLAILLHTPPKEEFLFFFFLKLLQEIHLFFIEFYGKPLNISLYGQNLLADHFAANSILLLLYFFITSHRLL